MLASYSAEAFPFSTVFSEMGSITAVKGKGREMEDSIVSLANIGENAGASGRRYREGVGEVGEVKGYKIHVGFLRGKGVEATYHVLIHLTGV